MLDPIPHILIATGTPPATARALAEATEYLIHTVSPRCILQIVPIETKETFRIEITPHTWIDPEPAPTKKQEIIDKATRWHNRYLDHCATLSLPEAPGTR